eukprot:4587578-Amphidinium_carterae.1
MCHMWICSMREEKEDQDILDVQEVQDGDEREAEYDEQDDNASQATSLSFDQWEQQNADALNPDEYGFGLTNDDIDNQLFDESEVQPDHEGMIPWDIVIRAQSGSLLHRRKMGGP